MKNFTNSRCRGMAVTLCGLLIATLSSCVSLKDITYFQPVDPSMDRMVTDLKAKYAPRIKAGDMLTITVSSLSEQANAMFNPTLQNANVMNQNNTIPALPQVVGFRVDDDGMVVLPILGRVKAAGYSYKEFSDDLTPRLKEYLESPTVMVRLANNQISVMGEVARPSVYTMFNDVITLPEALALAGDITVFGKKKNVLIIREEDGRREFARVDLTSREVFETPYYYLHAGDIVYVEPSAGKTTSSDRALQLAPIVISSLTLLVLIISTIAK